LRDKRALVAFLAIVLLAGGNGVAVRYSNQELPPMWGATLRFAVSTAILLVLLLALRIALPRGRALVGALLYGLIGFGATFALAYWALVDVGAGLAQIILALVPLLTFGFAVVQGLERFRWRGLLGATVALAGVAIVFRDQVAADVPLVALLAVVGAAACMAESNVVVKAFPRAHPIATNAVAMGGASVALLAVTLVAGEPMALPSRPETWIAVGYVSLLGSVAVFTLFVFVIGRWSASVTSYVMLLIPLVTVVLGAQLDNEVVTPAYFIGGPLVLAGVYLGAFGMPRWSPVRMRGRESETA